jgi:hypothetical protein
MRRIGKAGGHFDVDQCAGNRIALSSSQISRDDGDDETAEEIQAARRAGRMVAKLARRVDELQRVA